MARYTASVEDTFAVISTAGNEAQCVCPWHDDSSGHLYINTMKGLYLCMVCGAKGSLDDLSLPRIVVGTDDVRDKIDAIRTKKTKKITYYPEGWLKQFDLPHPFWADDRELPQATVDLFRLGYDPFTNRCTLPLRDWHGRILGVTYRRLDGGKPKYLEPKSYAKGRHLWGAWLITEERTVALVEGQMDAARGWASRVPALALMGARITPDQVKVLQSLNVRTVVLMMDNDLAGVKATMQVREALRGSGIRVKVGWYRDYWHNVKDPDNLNPQRYRKMFHSAIPITEWAQRLSIPVL